MVTKRLYGKENEWSRGQIKTSRKTQHVKIDDMKEMPDLICSKAAVGRNYNSTRDTILHELRRIQDASEMDEELLTPIRTMLEILEAFKVNEETKGKNEKKQFMERRQYRNV